ncbi:uncharacterized protein PFB0145c-like isoform X2 [Sipha flava]|uniref:Uncharacterized protein PFB0145c-like isoform X2 n=1 Tax=Sipha flava TaxID=143950 RepID=A0A8B8FB72_9HEMI|nr:uncharacterized protein PFB0145c-like isoform X2 [Sipha flava]
MDKFEELILRWVCLFDDFKDTEYLNIQNLVSSTSFKEFVDNVFCLKCSIPLITEKEKIYNTIKVNYHEFEIQTYEDLFNEENSFYTCIVVLLHALLKCTNNKFRDQLSERMDSDEQILLAKFLEATQFSLFTKQNILDALLLTNDINISSSNISSEIFSNNITPIKSRSRSHLQEFCESPKSKSLICQEKEKIIAKLSEDYKNECEENYKLAENIKTLQDINTNLSCKLEDKEKIIQFLKDEIEEFSKPKESLDNLKTDNALILKKLKQDIIDLEINNNELRQQITEFENKHKDIQGKLEKKNSDYENLLSTFDNIETENTSLKKNIDLINEKLRIKEMEITSLKDELCNKSISISPAKSSNQETNNIMPSNTLFDELSCLKLEEVTRDKEKYRHKYKSVKKDLINIENRVKDLDKQIETLKHHLHNSETNKEELYNKFMNKKKELQENQKKNQSLESKIKYMKDSIKDKENSIELMCTKLEKREKEIKELSIEMDVVKKAKTMIELILNKTNTEIEALHEENDKNVKKLQTKIEDYKKSEELFNKNIDDLQNNIKRMQDDLANKEGNIIFYEEKMAENYQSIDILETELKKMYQEKLILQSNLKDSKTENETQQKVLNDKIREMENYLEYYLDEIKDLKNTKTKIEEILHCKQNEIDRQVDLINYQKNIIETLQSEKRLQEISIGDLNDALLQKSNENADLKKNILDYTLSVNTLKEQLNTAINEKNLLEKNEKQNKVQMKTLNEEFQSQIFDLKNVLESRNFEINQFAVDLEKLKETLEKKQNDFNEQLIISNKQIETISHLRLEKYELEEKFKSTRQDLFVKENDIKSLEEKYIQSKLKIDYLTETINFKISENHSLAKVIENITTNVKNMQDNFDKQLFNAEINLKSYNQKIDSQTNKLLQIKNYILVQESELKTQIDLNNKQNYCILNLENEKLDLLEKCKDLDQTLLNKDAEVINLRKELKDYSTIIQDLKEKLGVMSIEKIMIETNLNETSEQFKKAQQNFTEQINDMLGKLSNNKEEIIQLKNQSLKVTNLLENKQKELDEQLKLTIEQCNIIKDIKTEKEILENQVANSDKNVITTQLEIEKLKDELDEHKSSILKLKQEFDSVTIEKISLENILQDTIMKKEAINKEYDEQLNEVKNFLKDSIHEINDLKKSLTMMKNDMNNKQIQLELITEENNKLNKTFIDTENQCINLQHKLKESNNCILEKEENVKLLKDQNTEYSVANESLEKQIIEVKQMLNDKHIELEKQIQWCNEQRETIVKINCEKESLCDKIKNLGDTLSHKEHKLNLCEEKLYACTNTIKHLGNQIEEMKDEKASFELQSHKTVAHLTDINQNLTNRLRVMENDLLQIQERLIHEQNELENQSKQLNEQTKTISFLNEKKDTLLEEKNKLEECLDEKECALKLLQEKINNHEKQKEEFKTQKMNLESKLNEKGNELENIQQESKQQLEDIGSKYIEMQELLKKKQIEIDKYVNKCNCQIETITLLTSERDNLINETNSLKNTILIKDSNITTMQEKVLDYEKQNESIKNEKITLEIDLKHTNKQLEITCNGLRKQLEEMEKKLSNYQKELNSEHVDLCEKNNLIDETIKLQKCLVENESALVTNQNKLEDFNKLYEETKCKNILLMTELNDLKCQFDNLREESTEKIINMDKKLCEAQKQLDDKQSEIEKQIELKNTSLVDIYQKINDLKNIKKELESILKKEKRDFETHLETCSNYSHNVIKNEPTLDHQDSLMEVITSADTFIEQNGIQLIPVGNCDDYSIIERLKKLFEALKMFIVNINAQGNKQILAHNEYASNEAYAELLIKSNRQLETIKQLETDMSELKSECNYKMTKIQQKTQEYITSEYEKKFERKREQMKQFCKDLETKIHQDYETKLMKYKEKINKDEIHIKELGQQLWEVSEKYLRLQQKERRDSTMSLPFEISGISQATYAVPKYNSFTLPKSNSTSQIRSLVEETTRSNQDNAKRNVPAGIGKIFPKEEDEEGEMFNHSCLADLKHGKVRLNDNFDKQCNERLSELQARNSLCPPHLRSCYAVETNYLPNASLITEEDIKTLANYSDCESENLIPNDRNKKKDRNQTSYKKPGPPTPSKNGGRVSLSGNAKITLKESKDSNTNKRRASSTPNKLFSLFMSKKN